jgi:hypothetical protein
MAPPDPKNFLLQYTMLMNEYGAHSIQAQIYLEERSWCEQFVRLAQTAKMLKLGFQSTGQKPRS